MRLENYLKMALRNKNGATAVVALFLFYVQAIIEVLRLRIVFFLGSTG